MSGVSLSFADARSRVLAAARPLPGVSTPLARARGRALRETVRAPHALPSFDNSAMDGYAVHAADLSSAAPGAPIELPVSAVLPAGGVPRALARGRAMRIMTGAAIPAGATAVVPFEDCERVQRSGVEHARFVRAPERGQHIRSAGADLESDALALEAGRELSAHDIALLAALGRTHVELGRAPRASIISTGDELLDVAEPLRPGSIRDSNTPLLQALIEEAGGAVISSERVPDRPELVAERIRRALERSDVTLTIGGVSAGDYDPVKASISEFAGIELWRVAMRPGRPQAFGALEGGLFFGLPGNPASVACVFETLVRPALRRLQGFARIERPRVRVRIAARIDSRRGRTDFVRAQLAWRDRAWWAEPAGAQLSGHLTPQSRAHALVIVPEAAEGLEAGDSAAALLLRWPG